MIAILGVTAGAQWLARTTAQEPPKKTEPAEKKSGELLAELRKALEGKDTVVPPPGLPPLPPEKKPEASTLPLPPSNVQAKPESSPSFPPSVPPVSAQPDSKPPVIVNNDPKLPPSTGTPSYEPPVTVQPQDPSRGSSPTPTLPSKPDAAFPPLQQQPGPRGVEPPPPPTVQVTPVAPKNSPWSLVVDMVDGHTVVIATVNQRHAFKIVCQSLDVQTGKHTLKATGKVQITGDMMNGSCDHLAIPLMDDRLVLEGSAHVAIQKMSGNVSSEPATSFELKGSTLDLRISELTPKLIQTTLQQAIQAPRDTSGVESRAGATKGTFDSKQWSPYGVLRRANTKVGTQYHLETSNGQRIELAAREGGSLDEYVGRTISVLGRTEQIDGTQRLRVTHIALP